MYQNVGQQVLLQNFYFRCRISKVHHNQIKIKEEVVDISETVRDRAKRTIICDPLGNIEVVYTYFIMIAHH